MEIKRGIKNYYSLKVAKKGRLSEVSDAKKPA